MAKKLNRQYGGISDDKMLTDSETMHDLFLEDVAQFTALDADLDAAFATDWMGKIDLARDFPTDESVADGIEELTNTLNTEWNKCKEHFQDSKYFIEKAFPGNRARHNKFGFDNYERMSTDQDKVLPFMDQFHDTASETANKTALLAAGYTQSKIDEIETLAGNFRSASRAQENAKKDRLEQTQTRIGLMNDVWKMNQKVNRASKNVFRGNYAKFQQYLLPGAGSNEPPEELAVNGTITNTTHGQPVPGAVFTLTAHDVSDDADDAGKYGITQGVPAGSTPYEVTAPGFVTKTGTLTIVEGETVVLDVGLVPV